MRRKIALITAILTIFAGAGILHAASSVILEEDFSDMTDPLSYLYQDPDVSHDSFHWDKGGGNMGGEARRGQNAPDDWENGTAERAYVTFSSTGYGDGDPYLEYTEDFDFSFDFNFSSFVSSANDERLMLGLWYDPVEADNDNPTHFRRWGNRQHFVGATVEEDGSQVCFYFFFGNGGDWGLKTKSDDLTGGTSLATGVNYRIEGHYRYDGSTYGQIFGKLTDLDAATTVGEIVQETVTQDTPDIYSVSYNNMNVDSGNHRFLFLRTIGAGNETWGGTRSSGPHFTSDNWKLEVYDPIILTSLNARPPINAVYLGHSAGLYCEGFDAGGTRYDVSDWVEWWSENPAIVSIDQINRTATGNAQGSTNIKAIFGVNESPLVPFQVLPPRSPHDTTYGLDVVLQWDELPVLKTGTEAGMASSYYRTFTFNNTTKDTNNYDWPVGQQSGNVDPVTIRELEGPGVITRMWMPWVPGPEFNLKFYFDGEAVPRIDTTTLEWYDTGITGHPAIEAPFVGTGTGGAYCYTPLYFEESLKIESDNRTGQNNFYQMNYLYLPDAMEVSTYTGTQDYDYWANWNLAAEVIAAQGDNPGPSGSHVLQASGTVLAGGTLVLADLDDQEGLITRLQIKLADPSDIQLIGMKLRVFYDGSVDPAIDMPVGEFFGAGRGRISYDGISLGTDHPDGYYCYLPMPFCYGVRIELRNDSAEAVEVTLAEVEYESQDVDKQYGYLHALCNETSLDPGVEEMIEVLSVPEGEGHYLGCLMTITPGPSEFGYLEGNDYIEVDGGIKETLYGTGLEDAFNGGYYYKNPFSGPFSGLLKKLSGVTSQYRHRIIDFIPFEDSILVQYQGVDCWNKEYLRTYETTAYWYQKAAPRLQISRSGGNVYHLAWDDADSYDLEFDSSLAFDSPDVVDVTGLTEYDYSTGEECGFFRLKRK